MERLAGAFGFAEGEVREGDAFNRELQEQKRLEKIAEREAKEKERRWVLGAGWCAEYWLCQAGCRAGQQWVRLGPWRLAAVRMAWVRTGSALRDSKEAGRTPISLSRTQTSSLAHPTHSYFFAPAGSALRRRRRRPRRWRRSGSGRTRSGSGSRRRRSGRRRRRQSGQRRSAR